MLQARNVSQYLGYLNCNVSKKKKYCASLELARGQRETVAGPCDVSEGSGTIQWQRMLRNEAIQGVLNVVPRTSTVKTS